ncbi:MAG: phosphoribosylanthranilate isomerase [Proteobacteria bacterium]|nr:phosphoribosylanthranilate isomerase [Pseudomonadota bacterium]MBU1739558.1 phosphoribosylanthranilate isomerase [Pseudomonadota bacterium]
MNFRTRIKICGITNGADARHAIAAGVDALGFIFAAKSPRKVEPELVREIVGEIPPFVDAVGVFVNEDPDLVSDIAKYCGLTMIQLHGQENVDYCRLMPRAVIKAFQVKNDTPGADFQSFKGVVAGYLLDTYHETMAGGTGKSFDWEIAGRLEIPGPVILAGGIGPANVETAIRTMNPFAVDVNSGVETEPGIKDHVKINELVSIVRRFDAELMDRQF